MGLVACCAVIVIAISCDGGRGEKHIGKLARYTMPIFLMHTIFAAGIRSVLLKLGVNNAAIHIILGLLISFAGPIAAAETMGRVKWLDVFLYPGKYIKLTK